MDHWQVIIAAEGKRMWVPTAVKFYESAYWTIKEN
jgi:hypothetical protein